MLTAVMALRWRSRVMVGAPLILLLLLVLMNRPQAVEAKMQQDLKAQIVALDAATEITLMVIPPSGEMAFRRAVDVAALPIVTCVYRIDDESGKKAVTSILSDGIIEGRSDDVEKLDLRIGIVFKRDADVIGELYFCENYGGQVPGIFDQRPVRIGPDAFARLRALPGAVNAQLIANKLNRPCK